MYSENMALPAAFTAARRAAAVQAVQQLINISYPSGPQQQTYSSDVQRANGTDRQTSFTVSYTLLRILCRQRQ